MKQDDFTKKANQYKANEKKGFRFLTLFKYFFPIVCISLQFITVRCINAKCVVSASLRPFHGNGILILHLQLRGFDVIYIEVDSNQKSWDLCEGRNITFTVKVDQLSKRFVYFETHSNRWRPSFKLYSFQLSHSNNVLPLLRTYNLSKVTHRLKSQEWVSIFIHKSLNF
jgi:hypothetical protein